MPHRDGAGKEQPSSLSLPSATHSPDQCSAVADQAVVGASPENARGRVASATVFVSGSHRSSGSPHTCDGDPFSESPGTQTWPGRSSGRLLQSGSLPGAPRGPLLNASQLTEDDTDDSSSVSGTNLAATMHAHIGRMDPAAYSDLPPVNFAKNPIHLKALDDEPTAPAPAPQKTRSFGAQKRSSPHEVYSAPPHVESSSSSPSTSSSDDAFNCRCVIAHKHKHKHSTESTSNTSDDDLGREWGRVTCGLNIDLASSSSNEGGMFIPEPVIRLDTARQKPPLPYHSKEDLQIGKRVWVVDEEDVETLLNHNFNRSYEMVCNGKMSGVIMRHNGDMTMVTFQDPTSHITCSLSMPRACLSLTPIESYEGSATRASNQVFGSYYCNVGPKTNGGRSAAEKRKGNLCQQFYECVPALRVPKESLGDLAEAQTLFQVGSLKEALEIVDRQLGKAEDQLAAERRGRRANTVCDSSRCQQKPATGPEGSRTTCHTGTRSATTFVVDILVLRSLVYMFLERFSDALADATRCAELEPSWVRGHLILARAHSALGNWAEATAALRIATTLLPTSSEVQQIASMTTYLVGIQQRLDEAGYNVSLTLDHLYRKRLHARVSHHRAGDVLCAEETPILAVTPLLSEHPAGRCSVCFRDGAEEMELITSTHTNPANADSPRSWGAAAASASRGGGGGGGSGAQHRRTQSTTVVEPRSCGGPTPSFAFFCSRGCQQRASLYSQLEVKHWTCLERAKAFIHQRITSAEDRWPLEMAGMTLRLFFMVVSTHRRLTSQCSHNNQGSADTAAEQMHFFESSQPVDLNAEIRIPSSPPQPPPLSVDAALKHLGLFPLASDTLTPSSRERLATLHEILVADFKDDVKCLYDKELFFYLYTYVKTYFTPVHLPPPRNYPVAPTDGGGGALAFFLPWLVGCTGRCDFSNDACTLPQSGSNGPRTSVCSNYGIPETIGRSSDFSIAALHAAADSAGGGPRSPTASRSSDREGRRLSDGDSTEANCRIVLSTAPSKVKPVVPCSEETGLCDPRSSCDLYMPEGTLLEMEVVRPIEAGQALRIHFLPLDAGTHASPNRIL